MIRALAKGGVFAAFGLTPPTTQLYRTMTRDWMGSQATHVDKLKRVWPGYVEAWREIGIDLEGADFWVHEGGWTPFPFFANHLVTGSAGYVTNHEGRMLDRYLARAVNGASTCDLPADPALAQRRSELGPLRWSSDVREAVEHLGGQLFEDVSLTKIPLADDSIDVCHSGGTLEHYRPPELKAFLAEAARILRPGAVMSHVFDHRDHLHHADASWPFLNHYRLGDNSYRVTSGTPLLYHNRLLPLEVASVFADAGFERIKIRRMQLPSRRYIDDGTDMSDGEFGVPRAKLARRFATASDDDLRTAAAHYLYRKPI